MITGRDGIRPNGLRVAIVDYGMGNIRSVANALRHVGCEVETGRAPGVLERCDAIILPGVGAFGEAMANLRAHGLDEQITHSVRVERKPLLGICLGMQLLVEASEERGSYEGLGLIPGSIRRIEPAVPLPLPHIGWNGISPKIPFPLFEGVEEGDAYYFVHSYVYEGQSRYVAATTDYGADLVAAIQSDNVFGVQFHPERSHHKGLAMLRRFASYVVTHALAEAPAC